MSLLRRIPPESPCLAFWPPKRSCSKVRLLNAAHGTFYSGLPPASAALDRSSEWLARRSSLPSLFATADLRDGPRQPDRRHALCRCLQQARPVHYRAQAGSRQRFCKPSWREPHVYLETFADIRDAIVPGPVDDDAPSSPPPVFTGSRTAGMTVLVEEPTRATARSLAATVTNAKAPRALPACAPTHAFPPAAA